MCKCEYLIIWSTLNAWHAQIKLGRSRKVPHPLPPPTGEMENRSPFFWTSWGQPNLPLSPRTAKPKIIPSPSQNMFWIDIFTDTGRVNRRNYYKEIMFTYQFTFNILTWTLNMCATCHYRTYGDAEVGWQKSNFRVLTNYHFYNISALLFML